MRRDQQVVLPHDSKNPLLMDWQLLHEVQARPDPPIPPTWVLGLERLDAGEQSFIALGDLERSPPC
jgi:hypothetical protein